MQFLDPKPQRPDACLGNAEHDAGDVDIGGDVALRPAGLLALHPVEKVPEHDLTHRMGHDHNLPDGVKRVMGLAMISSESEWKIPNEKLSMSRARHSKSGYGANVTAVNGSVRNIAGEDVRASCAHSQIRQLGMQGRQTSAVTNGNHQAHLFLVPAV